MHLPAILATRIIADVGSVVLDVAIPMNGLASDLLSWFSLKDRSVTDRTQTDTHLGLPTSMRSASRSHVK